MSFSKRISRKFPLIGLSGYLAGVTVAVKQVMPDYVLYRSPVGKITNQNVPLVVLACTLVMWAALGIIEGSYCTMFGSGLLVSWIYLRFYQVRQFLLPLIASIFKVLPNVRK